jgi:hypothetical protein
MKKIQVLCVALWLAAPLPGAADVATRLHLRFDGCVPERVPFEVTFSSDGRRRQATPEPEALDTWQISLFPADGESPIDPLEVEVIPQDLQGILISEVTPSYEDLHGKYVFSCKPARKLSVRSKPDRGLRFTLRVEDLGLEEIDQTTEKTIENLPDDQPIRILVAQGECVLVDEDFYLDDLLDNDRPEERIDLQKRAVQCTASDGPLPVDAVGNERSAQETSLRGAKASSHKTLILRVKP